MPLPISEAPSGPSFLPGEVEFNLPTSRSRQEHTEHDTRAGIQRYTGSQSLAPTPTLGCSATHLAMHACSPHRECACQSRRQGSRRCLLRVTATLRTG